MGMFTRRVLAAVAFVGSSLLTPRPSHAASCIPGFDFAAFGKDGINFHGNGTTDSYDDLVPPLPTISTTNGNICTNSTGSGSVTLNGSVSIQGKVCVGNGGTAGAPTISGGGSYQTAYVQTTNPTMTSVVVPTVGTNQGNAGAGVLPPNQTYNDVSVHGTLTLNAGTYVMKSLTLSGSSTLDVASGPIVVYITGSLDLTGGAVANTTYKAGNLVFLVAPTATSIKISGGAQAAFALYAPDTDVKISGNADIYGSIVGKTIDNAGNANIHYDTQLKNVAAGNLTCPSIEVSRTAPVIASITPSGSPYIALVQGTYLSPVNSATTLTSAASIATWAFPWITGHVRARVASSVINTSYATGTTLFDAADGIPAVTSTCSVPYTGACRAILTNTNATAATGLTAGSALSITRLDYTNASSSTTIGTKILAGLTSANYQAIIQKIQSAVLGGVDRSSVAVIGPSARAGANGRATVAYFGAADGMLHAVCAGSGTSPSAICGTLGKELWAFLPRVQVPLLATNMQRIDGTVRVVDMFGDFTSGTGTSTRAWRTILMFQTGYAVGATGAMYAIDVTDPTQPAFLWELTAPGTSPASVDLGTGLNIASGAVLINGQSRNLVIAETNNGGSAAATTAGVVVTARYAETGARAWQFSYAYPSPPRGVSTDNPLPLTGMPGGAVGVDMKGNGFFTDFVFGDLYGNLWRVDATTGTSRNGTGVALFSYSTNKHPIGAAPAIYSDGTSQYAGFATGGYADPYATSWSTTGQRILAVKLSYTGTTLSEASSGANVPVNIPFSGATASDKAYAQALVVGGQLFVTSDAADVNASTFGTAASSGHITAVNLTTSAVAVVNLTGIGNGAGSVANDGANIYGGYRVATTDGSTGTRVDTGILGKVTRLLWLRTM
jgi:hypothetical protein